DQKLKLFPVSVDGIWQETKEAYDRNNKGLDAPELTAAKANNQLVKIIDYEVAAGRITSAQRDMLMKGELPAGEEFLKELALLKAMLRVSTQRGGMAYVKASFDAYSGQTTDQVLLALPKIATEMTYNGKKISAKSAGFWAREFNGILAKQGIKQESLSPEAKKEEAAAREKPGTKEAYDDLEAFKGDWRVQVASQAIGQVDYEKYCVDGSYSVEMAENDAKAQVEGKTRIAYTEDEAVLKNCERILKITGVDVPGITKENLLDRMMEFGVVVKADTRKELREQGLSGGIIKHSDGKFYALSKEYQRDVPDMSKEVMAYIAEGRLESTPVQDIMRKEINKGMFELGLVSSKGELQLDGFEDASGYLGRKTGFTEGARVQIRDIVTSAMAVEVEDRSKIAYLIAAEPDVKAAIMAKGLDNGQTLAMIDAIEKNAGLVDANGNFVKEMVIGAIGEYQPVAGNLAAGREQEISRMGSYASTGIGQEAPAAGEIKGRKEAAPVSVKQEGAEAEQEVITDAQVEIIDKEAITGAGQKVENQTYASLDAAFKDQAVKDNLGQYPQSDQDKIITYVKNSWVDGLLLTTENINKAIDLAARANGIKKTGT
ncbi:MAG: hypothetical protein WC717_04390, partial [Candidatus Micrarchaeia archaeon]